MFTDGSYFPDTGHSYAACINLDRKIAYRSILHDFSGIYASELEALLQALFMIISKNWKSIVIFIDNKSILYNLSNRNIKFFCNNSDFSEIHRMIDFIINTQKIDLIFNWVPSHIGISGNEIVDSIAKTGKFNDFDISHNHSLSIPSINLNLNTWINSNYHNSWININNDPHICISTPIFPTKFYWINLPRKNQVALCRLITGRCLTRPLLNKFNSFTDIQCNTCNTTEDIHHIYNNCIKYQYQHNAIKRICGNPNYSFPEILKTMYSNPVLFNKINRILFDIYIQHNKSLPSDF